MLNREIYELKQNGSSISAYYTKMKSLWVELDVMDELPRINDITAEISEFI